MKILIVSDSHRHNENIQLILDKVKPVDLLVHCGDAEGSEYAIGEMAGCPMMIVTGNNDFFSSLPKELEFELQKYKVWLTHGHYYNVSMGPERIIEEAKAKGVDIVMFGHTHKPVVKRSGDIIAVNPGSISYPRQEGRKPSYIIMEIDADHELHFTINFLE